MEDGRPNRRSTSRAPADRQPTTDSERAEPLLEIARKRRDTIGGLVFTVPLFLGFAIGGPVLALLETEHHSFWGWIAGIAIWLLCTAFFAAGVYGLIEDLRKPGLILHANGFEFEKQAWAWADIEDIRPAQGGADGNAPLGLRAVFRPDRPLPPAPADLPFQARSFQTGGPPIDEVLREWLQRYRIDGRDAIEDDPV
jgi:hypothetical protein